MATYQEQVESYTGPFSDTDALSQFLTQGAKRIIDLLPPEKLASLSTVTTIPEGGIDVTSLKIISVDGDGFPARPVPQAEYGQFLDPDSLFYAVPRDPVFFITAGSIFVRPSSTHNAMLGVVYPEVLYTDEDILTGSREYDELIVLYAAMQCRASQFETARGLMPTPPASPDFTDELANIETQLTDNEDIELAQGYMQQINTQIAAYAQELQKFGIQMQAALNQLQFYQTSHVALQGQYQAALQLKFGIGGKAQ